MRKQLLPALAMPLLLIFTCFTQLSWAQEQKQEYTYPDKELQALRVTEPPRLDGVLDEPVWQKAQIATNFIQNRPTPGPLETHPTEVRILYDDAAIYVGAVMHDVSQDSILRELGRRDDLGNTDWFGVFFDTYNDQINGFGFFVTPAGVQLDARYSSNGEDFSWNAVWESSVSLQGTSWVAELKIPYSALRFSSKPEQLWGLNFMRNRQATRKGFFWNYVDPAKNGFVNQWGKLTGIRNIEAPLRLSFTPYVSAFAESYPYEKDGSEEIGYRQDFNFSGGMDVKYGINDAFTLDMTLIPDFSQVQSDNQVLNLSPFEVQFNENRPFFMEGTELFNKGDFFYSRRIGGRPVNRSVVDDGQYDGYTVIENPLETKMLNGTKVSGRTESGLGIGIFNAVVGRQHATLEDTEGNRIKVETQPLTNYNISVFDQSLKNNSFVTLVNTNVMRQGSTYDANLTGLLFRLANEGNKYAVDGKAALSQRYFSDSTSLGYMYRVGFGKVSGRFQYRASHVVLTDTYNPNDLGILFVNNTMEENLNLNYNFYQPFWKLLNMYTNLGATYSRRYKPDAFQNLVVYGGVNGTFKNFLSVGLNFNLEPVETYDFFEPRVAGWYYAFPTNYSVGGWVSSDYRKKFALDVNANYRLFNENERRSLNFSISPRYRVNNQLSFVYSYSNNLRFDDLGYANDFTYSNGLGEQRKIIFGLRDVNTVSNTLTGSYIFNNRMSLSLRARHYWSNAAYNNFFQLTQEGKLLPDAYKDNHNVNFNAFNIDMVYSWWFAPGSEISIVWKNAILKEEEEVIPQYFDNFSRAISSPQNNTLSVKVLYYLDYLILRNKLKGI
ncbi:MAG: carbohydrate binding family 9 domain-containing protein [Hymenobacteraceae bacterium]|nr:carbohydrate binding family 9 domain-containing protein [Hymenobacteraceae bacterium]MDX5482264.1 carbohydrate binding family 9 domain-containing protein [Hymenobacteraceae bacterium]